MTSLLWSVGFLLSCALAHPTTNYSESAPLLLLVSIDGFRYDFLGPDLTPNIWRLAEKGVYAPEGVQCQVSTYTTPNHHCMATGLYQESHGIIENVFYDPIFREFFDHWDFMRNKTSAKRSLLKKWFEMGGQEPIWRVNMKKSGHLSGSLNWPLGDAEYKNTDQKQHKFTVWEDYDNLSVWTKQIDKLIGWFVDPVEPINFGMYYNAQPDHAEHENDLYGSVVKSAYQEADQLIGYLIERLNETNLLEKMNLILTSDHGHAIIPNKNHTYNMSEYVNPDLVIRSGQSFFPRTDLNVTEDDIYRNLSNAQIQNGLPVHVWRKNDFPDKYHYKNNRRVGPVIVFDKLHFTDEEWPAKPKKPFQYPRSTHGFLNDHADMRPFFVAYGPAFKNNYPMKNGQNGTDFVQNIDLYPLMCSILNIDDDQCGPNNGSMARIGHILKNRQQNLLVSPQPNKTAYLEISTCLLAIILLVTFTTHY